MPKGKYKRKKTVSKAKESKAPYGSDDDKKSIRVFSSFEEMEEDNYKWLASLTPEQHLHNATELIKRIYADELKKTPPNNKRIYFD